MKLPDVKLLLYAMDEFSPHHGRAKAWLDETLSGTEPVGFTWSVVLAFVRLITKSQLSSHPLSVSEAFGIVEGWLEQPCAELVHPTERHLPVLRGFLEQAGTADNLTTDAHLAALAIEYGGEVYSADSDFRRFSGLRWTNPLS